MMYAQRYSTNDLFDMFANDADVFLLASMSAGKIAHDILDLAPDMEDAQDVARIISRHAEEEAARLDFRKLVSTRNY